MTKAVISPMLSVLSKRTVDKPQDTVMYLSNRMKHKALYKPRFSFLFTLKPDIIQTPGSIGDFQVITRDEKSAHYLNYLNAKVPAHGLRSNI